MMRADIDHLVVTAPSLVSGAAYIREQLGVEMQPGGTHHAMGTRNLLLKLDDSTYLEVLAVDPDMTAPGRPRWFDLDHVTTPGLATWVARVDDIHAAAVALGMSVNQITPMSRGALNWLITIPENGSIPETMPVLIQWLNGPHPATTMPASGCHLKQLHIRSDMTPVILDERCVTSLEMMAVIQSPPGLRTLRTSPSA